MPRGERRTKQEIIESQIQAKDNKIDFFYAKIQKLSDEKIELQEQLREVIEAESKAKEEAENNELLKLIKKHRITKEQLVRLIQSDE